VKLKGFFLFLFLIGCVCTLPVFAGEVQKYESHWESLDKRPTPKWFENAKFGIFIHWGVYSVPSWAPVDDDLRTYCKYSEWYWNHLTKKGNEAYKHFAAFHNKTYGPEFKYQDFASDFKAEMFNPDHWADIFVRSGAKYIVLTTKHHDGFCLWPSKQSWNWNSVDVGPHRDLLSDITKAVRARGLKVGFYYSLYEWYNPLYKSDVDGYVEKHMLPQMKDVVTRYEPDVLWADGEWEHPSSVWKSEQFLAWLFNESVVGQTIAINDRWGKESRSKHGGYYTTEYSQIGGDTTSDGSSCHPWEECRGIGHSFGYNRNEKLCHYATGRQLIHMLVGIISRGGNLLLDIGPTADGRIPVIMEERLEQIGSWLKVNGDAIYGTRKWSKIAEENGKVYYTSTPDAVYAIALDWPGDELVLHLSKPVSDTTITMLGYRGNLEWKYEGGRLIIDASDIGINDLPCQWAYSFKITGNIKP
jgi:alpha-L-fucosidase